MGIVLKIEKRRKNGVWSRRWKRLVGKLGASERASSLIGGYVWQSGENKGIL